MAELTLWIITTSNVRPIRDIAKDLADAGLQEIEVLAEIDVIKGRAEASVVARLRAVRGVVDVSPDIAMDVGPPDSRETW